MKTTVLAMLLISFSTAGFGQSKTNFGLRGGGQFTNLSNTDFDPAFNGYLGGVLSINLTENYTLQPEIGYSKQGGKAKSSDRVQSVNIHYITVSVVNKFYVNGRPGFHILIAPGLDFDTDDTLIGLANRTEGNDITFIDMTIAAGLGYEFDNGLGLEIRYKRGLIDVFSGGWHDFDNSSYNDESQFNVGVQLGVTYSFKK